MVKVRKIFRNGKLISTVPETVTKQEIRKLIPGKLIIQTVEVKTKPKNFLTKENFKKFAKATFKVAGKGLVVGAKVIGRGAKGAAKGIKKALTSIYVKK